MKAKSLMVHMVLGAAVLFVVPVSSMAYTSVNISGNGAFSHNSVRVSSSSSSWVSQSNSAHVSNYVSSASYTGGNKANYNTGGGVYIQTGNAHSNVTVTNHLNSNLLGGWSLTDWWQNLCSWW